MYLRNLSCVAGIAAVFSLSLVAQSKSEGVLTSSYKSPNYQAPRAQDGHADLGGVWSNDTATPLQRPTEFHGREFLTEQELTGIKKSADELFTDGNSDAAFGDTVFNAAFANFLGKQKGFVSTDGKTGDYSSVWTIHRDWTNRTSLIIDPKDGRLPELTERAKAAGGRASYVEGERDGKRPDSYENIGLSVRCLTFGAPRIGAGYNSYMQIFQTAKTVVVQQEMIHDARIIPVDGSPHPPANVTLWHGDSRGHWEGDTLVVDTTNYRAGVLRDNTEKLHVVERFQRTAPDYITWTVTFDDPGTWTKPWTVEVALRHTDDAIFEYACHEGNYAMPGILSGARAADAADAAARTGSGSK
jgi:hypothetical protein